MSTSLPFTAELIGRKYRELGHTRGWRFLTCPEQNIETASIALVTVNPGGDCDDGSGWCVEKGSAYVVEDWPSRQRLLQEQVRRMFCAMGEDINSALSGYLVPFRSPTWKDLPYKKPSLEFGKDLWREVFEVSLAKIVIAFGIDAGAHLVDVLQGKKIDSFPLRWKNISMSLYQCSHNRVLLVLPHLSRYKIFSKENSRELCFLTAWAATRAACSMTET